MMNGFQMSFQPKAVCNGDWQMNHTGDNLLYETILQMNGCSPEEVGQYLAFDSKKQKIRELLDECGTANLELNRRMGLIRLILDRKQKLQFYLVEQENHTWGLPSGCDLNDPDSFETLMLFDELAGVLDEIAMQVLQQNSSVELDDSLKVLLGMLNDAPYEKLDQVLDCLLILTEK